MLSVISVSFVSLKLLFTVLSVHAVLQAGKDVTLDFHDSGQDDVLFEQGDMQTHTFKDFPNSAQDDEEEEDKSEVLYCHFNKPV